MDFKKAKRNRKLDHWLVVILLTTLFGGMNFAISKIEYSFDMSPDQKYMLSRETLALLDKMEEPVDVVITIKNDNDLPKVIQKLLADLDIMLLKLKQDSKKYPINIYKVNLDSPRKLSGQLQSYNLNKENAVSIYSKSGNQKTIFKFEDKKSVNPYDLSQNFKSRDALARQAIWQSELYEEWVETGKGVLEPKFFRGEKVFLEGILEIAGPREERKVVYFTRGHGEASPTDFDSQNGFSELRRIIEESNLNVSTIDLSLTESIPKNTKFLVIPHPKGIFLDKEISNIRNFVLNEGGSVFLCIDPVSEISAIDRPVFGMRNILREWGLRCHDMLIHDPNIQNYDYFSGSYYLSTYPTARPHQIIKPLMEQEYSIFGDRCRPVESILNKDSKFRSSELLYSSRESWALSGWTNRKDPPLKNELLDIDGPVPIVGISEMNANDRISRIAVVGCSSIFSNRNLKRNSGNLFLARNIIRWINENNSFLDIPPKKISQYSVTMTENDFDKLNYLTMLIPGVIAIFGFFVGWLRKEL